LIYLVTAIGKKMDAATAACAKQPLTETKRSRGRLS